MEALDGPAHAKVRETTKQLLPGDSCFEPRKARAETEMRREAKGEMWVRMTPNVETLGILNSPWVPIRRRDQQKHLGPGGDSLLRILSRQCHIRMSA